MNPALALLEFASVAVGIEAGDAMVKRAPLGVLYSGTVQPGKYLVLIAGDVASVEESITAGQSLGGDALVDTVFLPDVHPAVVEALKGTRTFDEAEALGIIETATVAAIIEASDAAVKGAAVTIAQIEIADGLGGKGYALFGGPLSEVEAAVASGVAALAPARLVAQVVVPQLHDEMREDIEAGAHFAQRMRPGETE